MTGIMRRFALAVGCAAAVVALWMFHPINTHAATITVTTTADDATSDDGTVSLREAIAAIDNQSDLGDSDIAAQNPTTVSPFGVNDTIKFNIPGTGAQTILVGSDPSASGLFLPDIERSMVIDGSTQPGYPANNVVIDGGGIDTIFFIDPPVTARIIGLTMQNGGGAECEFGICGGAIVNLGTLTVTNCTFLNNNGVDEGGAIDNFDVLTVSTSTFTSNIATIGGAIHNGQLANVINSTFTNNTAEAGGAIFGEFFSTFGPPPVSIVKNTSKSVTTTSTDELSVVGSTFTTNTAGPLPSRARHPSRVQRTSNVPQRSSSVRKDGSGDVGGAIFICSCSTASVTNSTFSGNTSTDTGGAIFDEGQLTLTNVTVSGNSAVNDGGGIFVDPESAAVLATTNALIAGNTLTGGGSGPDVNGAFDPSSANNLLRIADGSSGLTNGTNGNIVGTSDSPINVLLGTLGNYGGPTQTIPLLPGSPAIDAGTAVGSAPSGNVVPAADQRGKHRVHAPDIGAFESQGFTLTLTGTPQSTLINTQFANPLAITVTPNNAGEPVQGGIVVYTANAASGATATLSGAKQLLDANGQTSVTATANGTVGGPYTVAVTGAGVVSASFSLTNTPPIITLSPTLPTGTKGIAYQTTTITASGGTGPYTFAVITGGPPSGLTFTNDGTLSGTPSAAGQFTFVVQATDKNGFTGSQQYTVTISATPLVSITVTYNGSTRPNVKVGQVAPFTATAVYQDGTTADVTTQVLWTGSNDTFATVDTSGKVTGQAPGTLNVTATLESISGFAVTTIIPPLPVGIQPDPAPPGRSGVTNSPAKAGVTGGTSPTPAVPSR